MTVGRLLKEMFDIILRTIQVEELRRIVKYYLEFDLDRICTGALDEIVFKVLEWAHSRKKLPALVQGVESVNLEAAAQLQVVFDRYTQIHAPATALQDPLARFFPYQQPLVDRRVLEARLAELWDDGATGVLVVRGERWSGRSHSLWRIRAVAQTNGIQLHNVDISQDLTGWDVHLMVERLRAWLGMPADTLADAAAQGSRKGLTFVGALYRQLANDGGRWCLVFDGLDRPGVNPEVREFAERMVTEVLSNNIPNLSIILLGYGTLSHLSLSQAILEESLMPLCRNDVCEFFADIANAAAVQMTNQELEEEVDAVMQSLATPMDRSGMSELSLRVKQRAKTILRRVRQ